MIQTLCQPIEASGRRVVAPRGPLLEWDSLARCMVPVALPNDRQPSELARGDVMLSGPWSFRGDGHALSASDRHERLRRAVLGALGFYDHERPDFEAPGYTRRREHAETLLCLGLSGGPGSTSAFAPPIAKPWQWTSSDDCYDARYEVTEAGGKVTALGDQGTRNLDATNASSVLTLTSSWSGALSAVTGTNQAQDRLACGGTASQWRIHSGNAWTVIWCGEMTDTAASHTWWSNRGTPTNSTQLGVSALYFTGTGYRIFRGGNGAANVFNPSSETVLDDAFVGKAVMGVRTSSAVNIVTRKAGLTGTENFALAAAATDADAGVLTLGAGTGGSNPMQGSLAVLIAHRIDSAGFLQSVVDHMRALARL